jgi:hypothetical protein
VVISNLQQSQQAVQCCIEYNVVIAAGYESCGSLSCKSPHENLVAYISSCTAGVAVSCLAIVRLLACSTERRTVKDLKLFFWDF